MSGRRHRSRGQRGSAGLAAVLVGTALAAALGVAIGGSAERLRAEARSAAVADLAAGAAVVGGEPVAAAVARANRAELAGHHVDPDGVVTVTVVAAGRTARASARPARTVQGVATAGTRTGTAGSLGSPG